MKQAQVFTATTDCPLPFMYQGRPCNVWINFHSGVTVESISDPWFQLSISEDGKKIYHNFFQEDTLEEKQYDSTSQEGQDVLQRYMPIIREATEAIQQAQSLNESATSPFTQENGVELLRLLENLQSFSFPLYGGRTGSAIKNRYGGACIQIAGTGERITLKSTGEVYYPETSPHSSKTDLALKKIIFYRSAMLSAALSEARQKTLPPTTPPPELPVDRLVEEIPPPLMPPPFAPPMPLPPMAAPIPSQDFSGIASCLPQNTQEISRWDSQPVSFEANGQPFSTTVKKDGKETKIEFTSQQTQSKISLSLDQSNRVTAVLVNDAPVPITQQINTIVKEGISAIRISMFLSQWNANARIKDEEDEAEGRNQSILETLIQDPSISDRWLYKFLSQAGIKPVGRWFFAEGDLAQPLSPAMLFEKRRKVSVGAFYEKMEGGKAIQQYEERWRKETGEIYRVRVIADLFKDASISDDEVILFLERNKIPLRKYIPRTYPGREGKRFIEFMSLQESQPILPPQTAQPMDPLPDIPKLLIDWETNARESSEAEAAQNKPLAEELKEKNHEILILLIENPSVTDEQLYQFLVNTKVRLTGRWFYSPDGEPTDLSFRIAERRNCPVTEFFKNGLIKSIKDQWDTGKPTSRTISLQRLVSHSLVSDEEVRQFIKDQSIDVPALLGEGLTERLFKKHRGKGFQSFMKGEVAPAQAAQLVPQPPIKLGDPLKCMITLNSHGAFSRQQFQLPPNVYVAVPHPQGFDHPYIVESPQEGKSFEEMIYRQGGGPKQFLDSSCNGWRVYKPGEMVNNLRLSPWTPSENTQEEFDSWRPRAPEDADQVLRIHEGVIPRFAMVPARNGKNEKFKYKGEPKDKVKVFGSTDLQTVIAELQRLRPDKPIVLVPFACNYSSQGDNPSVRCTLNNPIDLTSLFK